MIVLDYYVSLYSPWVFLGNERFRKIVADRDVAVNVKPVRFSQIFAATGGLPVNERPPERQAYRLMEMRRWSSFLGEDINQTPIDRAGARHHAIAGDLLVGHAEFGAIMLDKHVELFKAAFVQQHVQTLARAQLALFMLGLDAGFAPAHAGRFTFRVELFQDGFHQPHSQDYYSLCAC